MCKTGRTVVPLPTTLTPPEEASLTERAPMSPMKVALPELVPCRIASSTELALKNMLPKLQQNGLQSSTHTFALILQESVD